MKSVLICGERSFVGNGLAEKLIKEGFNVNVFSRGDPIREGNVIRGDVFTMDVNPHFDNVYDIVVNFIFIDNCNVDDNLKYMRSLHRFCSTHAVKHLIQISSISVYPNDADYVTERSAIETDFEKKGTYASVKMAIDAFLVSLDRHYEVITVRPGYVIADERPASFDGIMKSLLPRIGILLGNHKSSLPLVKKEKVHQGLIKILKKEKPLSTYLFLEGHGGTKAEYVRRFWNGYVISLPRYLTLSIAKVFRLSHIFSRHQENLVTGLFKTTYFDPSESEFDLQMSFSENSVGIIGSGAYGSYAVQCLMELNRAPSVTLYEVGDEKIKDETTIGYGSTMLGASYSGLQKGRYFGFGGASAKWGGQLLLFTHNEFKMPSRFLADIVHLNEKYRDKVFGRFGIKNSFIERVLSNGMFTKTGIWLGYFRRNLFKWFKVARKDIAIRSNTRVVKFVYNKESHKILGIELRTRDGRTSHVYHDRYILCAGAFESNRIILSSGMVNGGSIHFSDQLSQEMYLMKAPMVIDGEDYQYGVEGSSLVTKRMVGEVDGISYFAHPIYNNKFPFFQGLKELMFQGKFSIKTIWSVFRDIPSVIGFAWSVFIRHKVYVYNNDWSIVVDIENRSDLSSISLSDEKDEWDIPKLNVDFKIGDKSQEIFNIVQRQLKSYLDSNGVAYKQKEDQIHVEKSEDVYHPYGMFMSNSNSIDEFYTLYPNLLVVNTGVLPRVGGLNPTAACFPLIEEYVARYM